MVRVASTCAAWLSSSWRAGQSVLAECGDRGLASLGAIDRAVQQRVIDRRARRGAPAWSLLAPGRLLEQRWRASPKPTDITPNTRSRAISGTQIAERMPSLRSISVLFVARHTAQIALVTR